MPFAPLPASLVLHRLPPAAGGSFGRSSLSIFRSLLDQVDAVAAGPGWGNGEELADVLRCLLESGKPLVLDADALNVIARLPEPPMLRPDIVITPHPGEAARLFAARQLTMPADRRQAARQLAEAFGCVVLLKGPQSVVAAPDGNCSVNSSGSPALGVAGSGDVLTGLAGALLAAGHDAFETARLAAFLHGMAGECVPRRGLTADDLPERIRQAMLEVCPIC